MSNLIHFVGFTLGEDKGSLGITKRRPYLIYQAGISTIPLHNSCNAYGWAFFAVCKSGCQSCFEIFGSAIHPKAKTPRFSNLSLIKVQAKGEPTRPLLYMRLADSYNDTSLKII
jgi:hypothetical protein